MASTLRVLCISNAEVKSATNYPSTSFDREPAPSPFVVRLPFDLYANGWLLGLGYRSPRHHILRLRQKPPYSPRRVHLLRSLVHTVTTLTDMPLTASTPCGYHARMVHTFTQLFVSIGSLRIASRVPFPELAHSASREPIRICVRIRQKPYRICFTHSDLSPNNILVDEKYSPIGQGCMACTSTIYI